MGRTAARRPQDAAAAARSMAFVCVVKCTEVPPRVWCQVGLVDLIGLGWVKEQKPEALLQRYEPIDRPTLRPHPEASSFTSRSLAPRACPMCPFPPSFTCPSWPPGALARTVLGRPTPLWTKGGHGPLTAQALNHMGRATGPPPHREPPPQGQIRGPRGGGPTEFVHHA